MSPDAGLARWEPAPAARGWWRPGPAAAAGAAPPREAGAGAALPYHALWLFTLVLLVAPQSLVPPLAALRPALVLGTFAVLARLADRWRRPPAAALTRPMWPAAALLAWAVVTVPVSYWPGGSVAFLTGVYVKTLALFWLACEVIDTRARLRGMAWALALMGAVPAALTLGNWARGRLRGERVIGYETALGSNPNDAALLFTVLLPLALALFALARHPAARALLAVVVVVDVAAVVVTFSRGGFLALVVALGLALGAGGRRARAAVVIALLVAAALGLPGGYLAHMATITDIDADPTGSARQRWSDMQAGLQFIAAHPVVGAGIGNDILALNEARGARWKAVHNVYLQYGVELGLPGLLLFLWLLVAALRAAAQARRLAARRGDETLAGLARALQCGLLTFAVAGLFSTVGYHFPLYFLAGLAVAARAIAAGAPPAAAGSPAGWWRR